MPLYEFECPNGTITEKLVKMGTQKIECPKCHKKATKIISTCSFILKGGGWAVDGYASER
jgi:putative FmdB family regulatory protein